MKPYVAVKKRDEEEKEAEAQTWGDTQEQKHQCVTKAIYKSNLMTTFSI